VLTRLKPFRSSTTPFRASEGRISNLRRGLGIGDSAHPGRLHRIPDRKSYRQVSLLDWAPPQIKSNMAKKILVVDDNPTIRRLLCHLFDADEDYEICAVASNGEEAISLAVEDPPHLIILDLSMPVMDGLASARELKTRLPDVPIILFTQYADLGRHLLRSDLPVDRIVSKSESIHLMQHVRSLVPV
jgi:CheY-like chemotaxis protein